MHLYMQQQDIKIELSGNNTEYWSQVYFFVE